MLNARYRGATVRMVIIRALRRRRTVALSGQARISFGLLASGTSRQKPEDRFGLERL